MANTKFDSKSFNAEAFKYMVDRVPNTKLNELVKSRALAANPDVAGVFNSQNGTGYARLAMRGLLDGDAVNYDGATDISASGTKTMEQGFVVTGRAKAWAEKDFSYDITGGVDWMGNIAAQVSEYWSTVDQNTILKVLAGAFSMTGTKNSEFVAKHTLDITGSSTGKMAADSLNTAIAKACGDNKKKFSVVFMHSAVATNLENLRLVDYMKYTDASGVQRSLDLATWNGKVVIIDDSLPMTSTTTTAEVKGTYTLTIGTKAIVGDKITIDGVDYTCASSTDVAAKEFAVGTSATTQATALTTILSQDYAGIFNVTSSAGVITFTQIIGGTGAKPVASATQTTSGTLVITGGDTVAGTTGVAEVLSTVYTTYVCGDGAIIFNNIGAKVPYEMDRNPATNGGVDTLYTRQRKVIGLFGISYEKASQASNSPTDSELASGSNWTLVHSGEAAANDRTYINHKAIPICRILSKG